MLAVFLRPRSALLVRPDYSPVQFSMEIWGTLEPTPCHADGASQRNSQNLELYTMDHLADSHLFSSPCQAHCRDLCRLERSPFEFWFYLRVFNEFFLM